MSTEVYQLGEAAYDNENPIGFIAIKSNNKSTAEIYVIGIDV